MSNTLPGEQTSSSVQRGALRAMILCSCLYLALVTFANLGSLRIITLLGLSLDGGTLLYPFTFTMRDVLHKKTGASHTRFVILLTAGLNLLMFAFCWLVGILPADPTVGAQSEYLLVLAPGFRLVLGSILAMALAELLDTGIYSLVRSRCGSRRQWLRVLLSNAISVPVDTVIFLLVAFGGRYSGQTLLALFLSNILLKYLVAAAAFWTVYLVKEDAE